MNAEDRQNLDVWGGTPAIRATATGCFRVEQIRGTWWFIDPDGNGFLSMGVNHCDDTDLKYPHNEDIWRDRYGGDRVRWLHEGVATDLRDWGFNTLGWSQQWISGRGPLITDWDQVFDIQHSLGLTAEDCDRSGMPYVTNLRVAQIEDWNGHPVHPDVFSADWEDYVEYQARQVCQGQADNQNLFGYFLLDIPSWAPHATGSDFPQLMGLGGAERNGKLYEVAHKYYETVSKHIRRYDPNHLLLGDRYNGNKGIPQPVLDAAAPFIDVLSVQYFTDDDTQDSAAMHTSLGAWSASIDKPVLIADIGNCAPTEMSPHRDQLHDQAHRGLDYRRSLEGLLGEPWFVGWHWCGYVENPLRGWGVKDPFDQPYEDFVDRVRAFNDSAYDRRLKAASGAALDASH